MPITPSPKVEEVTVQKTQVLLASAVTFLGSFLFLIPGFPFHKGFCVVSFASFLFHIGLFFVFDKLSRRHLVISNFVNIILLGFAIHFTGGILSPFVPVFMLILFSGAGYGFPYRPALLTALIVYASVVMLEFAGLMTPLKIRPSDLYRNWPSTILVGMANVAFMLSSGSIYKLTISKLRSDLEKEIFLKHSMIKELTRLEAPSQMGLLVQKIAHDIKGPLGAISGFVELLQTEAQLSPESLEDCRTMYSELKRIQNLLGRMNQYTKTSGGKKEWIELRDVVDTVLTVMAFLPGAKSIHVSKTYPNGTHLFVNVNREELQQALFNIVKNAVESLSNQNGDKNLTVHLKNADGQVDLEITDNGPGFPSDMLEKISQAPQSTKKEGSGLGLIIVREIIESNNGELIFQPTEKGAQVIIRLPVRYQNASPDAFAPRFSPIQIKGGKSNNDVEL